MGNIFGVIADFGSSAFMDEYKWIIVFLMVFCVLATEFVCSIYTHVIVPRRYKGVKYLMPNYRSVLAELESLKADNIKLKEELERYKNMKG